MENSGVVGKNVLVSRSAGIVGGMASSAGGKVDTISSIGPVAVTVSSAGGEAATAVLAGDEDGDNCVDTVDLGGSFAGGGGSVCATGSAGDGAASSFGWTVLATTVWSVLTTVICGALTACMTLLGAVTLWSSAVKLSLPLFSSELKLPLPLAEPPPFTSSLVLPTSVINKFSSACKSALLKCPSPFTSPMVGKSAGETPYWLS